jgi:carboxypeptidase C (cathepsin A)
MELITILNRCHRFRGFVYQQAHFSADKKSTEVAVRLHKGSVAICSRRHLPAPGDDQLGERRFEFIALWGFLVFLLYTMRSGRLSPLRRRHRRKSFLGRRQTHINQSPHALPSPLGAAAVMRGRRHRTIAAQIAGQRSGQRFSHEAAGLRYLSHMRLISLHSIRDSASVFMLASLMLAISSSHAGAQEAKPAPAAASETKPATPPAPADAKDKDKEKEKEKAGDKEAPLPADAHAAQSIQFNGKPLNYTVVVGTLPVYDNGKKAGEVVFTAYTMEGPERPVTFALNGGPGAASVFLNFGAIGPKHIEFGDEGDSPSDTAKLVDNPGTWLDFTDLVFLDPIGTGYSRSLAAPDDTRRLFYSTDADIHYLSRIIYDWLVANGRLNSRKYLVGESYGGYRGPRITHYLQTTLGVAMNGVVLVSPYLNPALDGNADVSPVPWMLTLPSITAAHLEREHKLTPEAMAPVIAYTRGEYAVDLLKGRSDPAATPRIVKRVTEMTGLEEEFVRRAGGRLDTGAYLREVFRESGRIGSIYDSNVTGFDPFPFAPEQRTNDPMLESIIAPTTTAMVDFVTRTVGWKTDARYNTLSSEVGSAWDRDSRSLRLGAVPDLRRAVAADPKLRIIIAHGWNDLSCPFMGSVLTVDQMPMMGDPTRVAVREYPGGHMFYSRPASQAALRQDVQAMFAKH